MKILLVAVNAKYIHTNLAIRDLAFYADPDCQYTEIAEYTINQQTEEILADIYRRKPDVLAFSCYIWNMEVISALIRDFARLCPNVPIWVGGPEVSYDAEAELQKFPELTGVIVGEGEIPFRELVRGYVRETKVLSGGADPNEWDKMPKSAIMRQLPENVGMIPGVTYRSVRAGVLDASTLNYRSVRADVPDASTDEIHTNPSAGFVDMDAIPFVYDTKTTEELQHKIIYYETSRGCPFSCSYCLSSLEKVRFRSMELVQREVQFFLDARVPQVKFVDRTFNCRHEHTAAIWNYIREHDNGVTNFHFEVAADLLTDEEIALLHSMRPGLVQLEIGVQSTNPMTLYEIDRVKVSRKPNTVADEIQSNKMQSNARQVRARQAIAAKAGAEQAMADGNEAADVNRDNVPSEIATATVKHLTHLRAVVDKIYAGKNVHQHLDLIAGLPYEDFDSFGRSFNDVYAMHPEQLQMGFLKALKGSKMHRKAADYGLVCTHSAPYEVLRTKWLNYDEICELKRIEDVLDTYYNSNQFAYSLEFLLRFFDTPFDFYRELAAFHEKNHLFGLKHSRLERFDILREFGLMKIEQAHSSENTNENEQAACESPQSSKEQRADVSPKADGKTDSKINDEQSQKNELRERLLLDLYLRENSKKRPGWADLCENDNKHLNGADVREDDAHVQMQGKEYFRQRLIDFYRREAEAPQFLHSYAGYDSKQLARMTHSELFTNNLLGWEGDGPWQVVFDYRNRDALTGNSSIVLI